MSDLDLEQLTYEMLQDAKLLACARPEQLIANREWLIEAQDEIARAIAKTERLAV